MKGLAFTDGGLGLGNRMKGGPIDAMRDRSPGPIYNTQQCGSVSLWIAEASLPTKQPCTQFHSTVTNKMGARRDPPQRLDRQAPGPGTYETKGFTEELLQKHARRPRVDARGQLLPPPTASANA